MQAGGPAPVETSIHDHSPNQVGAASMSRSSIRRFSICSALIVFGLSGSSSFAGWSVEPVDMAGNSGWSLCLDVDSTGSQHAAYFTTNPNGDFRSARRGADVWEPGPVLDNAYAFAVDDNDDRYFVNVVAPDYYPHFSIQLDNGLVLQQKLANTRISSEVFLDFDSLNRPQIGYVDTTARQLKHTFWNGSSWATRTVASGPEFQYGNSGFTATLDDADQMHFAWGNFDTGLMKYAKPNGSTWQVSTPFPTLDASPYDIAVEANGNVHLAYDVSTGSLFTGGLFYALYSGSIWNGGRVTGLESFGAGRSRLVVDETGAPHLFTYDSAFSGPEYLKHVYRENGVWVSETIDSYTGGSSGPEAIEARLDQYGYHVLYSTGHQNIFYAHLRAESPLDGDFNHDNIVDAADYTGWRDGLGSAYTAGDYTVWKANFGQQSGAAGAAAGVPEASMLALSVLAFAGGASVTSRQLRQPR